MLKLIVVIVMVTACSSIDYAGVGTAANPADLGTFQPQEGNAGRIR